ncbi:MAG: glycosyltransferase family 2 protein [Deltaproteobacteria bacterium]|nr:glycosyltransferase family 2 protein [Deltaproteobacteria bacterium]
MRSLVIIPAYNESGNIGAVVDSLAELNQELEILVINDGSADDTGNQARRNGQATVLDLACNLGIGGAVQTGFIYALRKQFESAIKFDGDGQHLATEIEPLLRPLRENRADVVIGSRFHAAGGYKSTFSRRLGIRLLARINSLLLGRPMFDSTSGFRAYNRKAIEFLAQHYPAIDYPEPEEVILLARNGFRVMETAVTMAPRQTGTSSIGLGRSFHYMAKVLLAILISCLRPAGGGKQDSAARRLRIEK